MNRNYAIYIEYKINNLLMALFRKSEKASANHHESPVLCYIRKERKLSSMYGIRKHLVENQTKSQFEK
jgi:hypothetical protein